MYIQKYEYLDINIRLNRMPGTEESTLRVSRFYSVLVYKSYAVINQCKFIVHERHFRHIAFEGGASTSTGSVVPPTASRSAFKCASARSSTSSGEVGGVL